MSGPAFAVGDEAVVVAHYRPHGPSGRDVHNLTGRVVDVHGPIRGFDEYLFDVVLPGFPMPVYLVASDLMPVAPAAASPRGGVR